MLRRLSVQNFAIIEDINTTFYEGMTAITGGTGAGKSLVIDSILLLLGGRADTDLIRYGSNKAVIEGVFDNTLIVKEILKDEGINEQEYLVIRREILANSKNITKVNDTPVSLVTLKKIANHLADIHVQNDTLRLINPDSFLFLLDQFGDDSLIKASNDYQIAYFEYKKAAEKYKQAKEKRNTLENRLDMLKFQYDELSKYEIQENEDVSLDDKIKKLENFDRIFSNLKQAYESLENEYFSLDSIYEAGQALGKIAKYDDNYKDSESKILDCYYILSDIKSSIKDEIENLDFNPDELDSLQKRLQDLRNLQKKYKKSNNELIELVLSIKEELDLQNNYDEVLEKLLNNMNKKKEIAIKTGSKLSQRRKEIAKNLEEKLVNELYELDLRNAAFKISFEDVLEAFDENGMDRIDFLISLNKGEPLRPLCKVASGGEMSRIMLAFKTIFTDVQGLSLIVFDEIDTGISGYVASQVAKKMKQISSKTQVLCITHLPQVAGIADHHINIKKIEENERTKTNLSYLDFDERVKELAMMLSGEKISSFALEAAKELLNS